MTFQSSMAEALRRTRSGDLMGATALIRAALVGDAAPRRVDEPVGNIIDLKPERVTVEPSRAKAASSHGCFEPRHHVGPAGRIVDNSPPRPSQLKEVQAAIEQAVPKAPPVARR